MKFTFNTLYTSFLLLFGIALIAVINLNEYNPKQSYESQRSNVLGTTVETQDANWIQTRPKIPLITIDAMFDNINNSTQFSDDETWTLLVTGDVMVGRTVNFETIKSNDFTWAYRNIGNLLSSADLTFINLESPLVENCPIKNDGMIFCGNTKHIQGLASNGIDAASLANNHSMNYGSDGLNTTMKLLDSANITTVGVENPQYFTTHGIKIALLSYDDVECYNNGVACLDKAQIAIDIEKAKEKSDLIIIMYHWGAEYTHTPSARQLDVAHFSIDSGADLVLGNHPHWYQPVEIYNDKVIMYSHGNFIFDQMWSEKTKEGIVGKYTFYKEKLVDVEFVPVYIKNFGQPKILTDKHRENVLSNLQFISQP